MQQSPSWEGNQFSAGQEIPCILWNLKVHNHIYKYLPPVPVLSTVSITYLIPGAESFLRS